MIDSRPGSFDRPIWDPERGRFVRVDVTACDAEVWVAVFLLVRAYVARLSIFRGGRSVEGVDPDDVASDIVAQVLERWDHEKVSLGVLCRRAARRVIDLHRKVERHRADHATLAYLLKTG